MKIRIFDDDIDFEIEGKTEAEVEQQLIDWYLETGSFDDTVEY